MKRRCIPLNKFIFRRKPSEKKEQSLLRLLLPSVLGFALCFVCLAATTWAWFVVSVTSEANTIQTASFGVEMTVNGNPVAADANGKYALPTGTYSVTMSKTGDANGYFDFKVGEKQYRTTAITANTPITITIENTGASSIICSFTSFWGTPEGATNVGDEIVKFKAVLPPEIISITDGETIIVGEPSEEPTDESEQENQQQEEENPSDENNPADDTNTGGEGESKPDTPAEGEGGQQGDEQQPSEPSTPADGEQGGEQTDVSGDTTGGDTGDDTVTGGETPTDTPTPAGGDVPTEPVVTTDPTAQSEGGAPADPAPIE